KRPSEAARGIPPRAARRALPVTKLSASVVAHLSDRYTVLGAGAALGRGCGPLVVCRAGDQRLASLADLRGRSVAIPGQHTTAHLWRRTRCGAARGGDGRGLDVRIMRFEQRMPALEPGSVDAGLSIHESRFTYADHGLVELADLGALWERATGL